MPEPQIIAPTPISPLPVPQSVVQPAQPRSPGRGQLFPQVASAFTPHMHMQDEEEKEVVPPAPVVPIILDQAQPVATVAQPQQVITPLPIVSKQLPLTPGVDKPLQIYSNNTQAVKRLRRSTRLWYFVTVVVFASLAAMIGLYWRSLGYTTNFEKLPFVQSLLG